MREGLAKYVAVREALAERIRSLEVGERLAPEPRLCEEFRVSRITLRHAVDGLVEAGLLRREHGRGTFVAATSAPVRYPERFARRITGFHGQQSAEGRTVTSVVDGQSVLPAWPEVAAALALSPGAPVVALERRRSVNGSLHHIAASYVPADVFPAVAAHDFATDSLLEFLRTGCGVTPWRNDVVVALASAGTRESSALGVAVGDPLLVARSTVYDETDRPFLHGIAHFTPASSQLAFGLSLA